MSTTDLNADCILNWVSRWAEGALKGLQAKRHLPLRSTPHVGKLFPSLLPNLRISKSYTL
jgi:hypothetical protein